MVLAYKVVIKRVLPIQNAGSDIPSTCQVFATGVKKCDNNVI